MPLPSVTIAVPAFNHGRYVIQALDSMLDSGLPEVEIIVCDDASTDDTAALIEAWQARHAAEFTRLHLIRHRLNAGLCQSLNDIIAEARGELIHVVASDDYFLPGGLLTKTRTMAEHPEWQVAFCDGQAVGPSGELYLPSLVEDSPYVPAQLQKPEGIAAELLYHWGPPAHQMTWRRSAYQVHGGEYAYDPTVFCEDYDSALWAAGRRVLGYIPSVCQAYRYRSWPQTANRNSLRDYRDNAFVLAKHARHFEAPVARGMELLPSIYHHVAIGDTAPVDALWRVFHAHRDAYDASLADPQAPPPPGPDPEKTRALTDALKTQILHLDEQWKRTKQQLREAHARDKERRAQLTSLKADLAAARHRLRYHATNPMRALRLWWQRER